MQMLKRIHVAGWKSIKDQTVDLTALTVAVGANGAGKSNLLALFKLLNAMFANTPGFRNYVAQSGFADSILHYGSKETPIAEMELAFAVDNAESTYLARWASAAGGTLIFTDERVLFQKTGWLADPVRIGGIYDVRKPDLDFLVSERDAHATPEEIDLGQHSHPKNRIKQIVRAYDENVAG